MPPRYKPFDWYQTPLYYDIVFDAETALECDFLAAMWRLWGRGGASRARRSLRVLEPACGSGRLMLELSRRGHRCCGIDISAGALAFARARLAEHGLKARLIEASMDAFSLPQRFELAHCLVSSFRYLVTEDAARAHLLCVADALIPGGIYALGFHLCDYSDTSVSRERHLAERDAVRVTCNIQAGPPVRRTRQQAMRARLLVETDAGLERYQSCWSFRTYSARQFRSLLAQVPAFEHVATYDFDYDQTRPQALGRDRYDQVVILRRRD